MSSIAMLREKLEALRALEAEHRFGNVITPGVALAPISELPDGTIEVLSLFSRLEGSYLLFKTPRDIRTPDIWRDRGVADSPIGEFLVIGAETFTQPEYPVEGVGEEDRHGYGVGPASTCA